jgi:hypothetical protein
MVKLDADNTAALDTNYEATFGATAYGISPDIAGAGAQHKTSFRKTLISALSHKRAANELIDSIAELESALYGLSVKLDAEAGTLADTDYEAILGMTAIDADINAAGAQHKASIRKSLISALSHRRLANVILDTIIELQTQINAALVQLDIDATAGTGALTGLYLPFVVEVINPDAI